MQRRKAAVRLILTKKNKSREIKSHVAHGDAAKGVFNCSINFSLSVLIPSLVFRSLLESKGKREITVPFLTQVWHFRWRDLPTNRGFPGKRVAP